MEIPSTLFDLTQINSFCPFGFLNEYKNNPVLAVSLELVTVVLLFQNVA